MIGTASKFISFDILSLENEMMQYCMHIHKYRLCLHFQAFEAAGMQAKLTEK